MLTFMLALKLFGFLMCSSVIAIGIPFILAQFDFKPRRTEYFGEETPVLSQETYPDEIPTQHLETDWEPYLNNEYYHEDDPGNKWKVIVRKQEVIKLKKVYDAQTGEMTYLHDGDQFTEPQTIRDTFNWLKFSIKMDNKINHTKNVYPDEYSCFMQESDEIEFKTAAPPSTGNKLLDKLPRKK